MTGNGSRKRESRKGEPGGGFEAPHLFAILTLIAAGGSVVAAGGASAVHAVFVAMAVGSVGAASYALYRAVWPLVAPSAAGESSTAGRHAATERARERDAARRAVGDLEFDRAMGKVSEADFGEMRARLQRHTSFRDLIERDLAARRASSAAAAPEEVPAAAGEDGGSRLLPEEESRLLPRACVCGTSNDADAQFCKQCGKRLSA